MSAKAVRPDHGPPKYSIPLSQKASTPVFQHKALRSVGLGVAALLTVGAATLGASAAIAAPPAGTGNGGNGLITFSPATGSNTS